MATSMNEEQVEAKFSQNPEYFYDRYADQMSALESFSPLGKIKGISRFDIVSLGKQLKQFENYTEYLGEAGNLADLGKVPDIALDVITAAYGASVVPLLASVQPIEEERGIVYFKDTQAVNTRGNVTAGDSLNSSNTPPAVYAEGYANEMISGELMVTTVGATLSYAGTVAGVSVRPRTLSLSVATLLFTATDDGNGNILGVGLQGTINYATGAWTLDFIADPAGAYAITVQYGSDFENTGTIPQITSVLNSTDVSAEIFVLGAEIGMFKSYALKKRFNDVAEESLMQDLTNEVTAEVGNTLISRMNAGAVGNATWSRTPVGIGWAEHKLELKDQVYETEATINTNAGRGVINVLVAGISACTLLATLPGFKKENFSFSGPGIYGTLDNTVVIRAPQLSTSRILVVYKGNGFFDAPAVYAPYMPLFSTQSLRVPANILKREGMAAVWAGIQVVNGSFMTSFDITP